MGKPFPSVGRVVHVFLAGQWRAALVTAAARDRTIKAVVFPGGNEELCVPLEGDDVPLEGHWRWPPRVSSYEDYLEAMHLDGTADA